MSIGEVDEFALAWSLYDIGREYFDLGKVDLSHSYFQCIEKMSKEIKDPFLDHLSAGYLTRPYQRNNQADLAEQLLRNQILREKEQGIDLDVFSPQYDIARFYVETGKYSEVVRVIEDWLAYIRDNSFYHQEINANKVSSKGSHQNHINHLSDLF